MQDTVDSDDSDADEDKYADQADMPGTKFDSKTRTTVRNLRIREDTAKYLYNLDPNSAFYDPKTRSMRENPFKNTNKDPSEWVCVRRLADEICDCVNLGKLTVHYNTSKHARQAYSIIIC